MSDKVWVHWNSSESKRRQESIHDASFVIPADCKESEADVGSEISFLTLDAIIIRDCSGSAPSRRSTSRSESRLGFPFSRRNSIC